jgi:hypothetical protein
LLEEVIIRCRAEVLLEVRIRDDSPNHSRKYRGRQSPEEANKKGKKVSS